MSLGWNTRSRPTRWKKFPRIILFWNPPIPILRNSVTFLVAETKMSIFSHFHQYSWFTAARLLLQCQCHGRLENYSRVQQVWTRCIRTPTVRTVTKAMDWQVLSTRRVWSQILRLHSYLNFLASWVLSHPSTQRGIAPLLPHKPTTPRASICSWTYTKSLARAHKWQQQALNLQPQEAF